jgi:hypothetical protein
LPPAAQACRAFSSRFTSAPAKAFRLPVTTVASAAADPESDLLLQKQGLHGLRSVAEQLPGRHRIAADALAARKEQHLLDQALEALQLCRRLAAKRMRAASASPGCDRGWHYRARPLPAGCATGVPAKRPSRPWPPGADYVPVPLQGRALRSHRESAGFAHRPNRADSRRSPGGASQAATHPAPRSPPAWPRASAARIHRSSPAEHLAGRRVGLADAGALSSTTTPAGKALSNSERRSESASLASYCRRNSPLATASSAVSDSTRPCSPGTPASAPAKPG